MEDKRQPDRDLRSFSVKSIQPERKFMDNLTVHLEPDVAVVFPDSEVVNETLRLLIRITKEYQFSLAAKEDLKEEISKLDEQQISKVADYISSLKIRDSQAKLDEPTWRRLTPAERAKDFRGWVSQLPKSGSSLPDEAFSRDNIYEE